MLRELLAAAKMAAWRARRALLKRKTGFDRVRMNLGVARRYHGFSRKPLVSARFVLLNRESENVTYDIDNVDELAQVIGLALECGEDRARNVLQELEEDDELQRSISHRLRTHGNRNRNVGYGRRLGWYAVARLTSPKLIVETGVHDGLGSTVLLRALERNAAEGVDGILLALTSGRTLAGSSATI
jgi:hypothetical protein